MDLTWLIIGGGIHGVHTAVRLIGEAKVPPERLRLLDPADRLLDRWRTCTETTGMSHLRSPSVHHLDLEPSSLQRFAGKPKSRRAGLFAPPYDRPSLKLFNAHCDHVVANFGLSDLHVRDYADACTADSAGVCVQTSAGTQITCQNVVLAIGAGEEPQWPGWAPRDESRVGHVFDPSFDGWPSTRQTVVVIGGGISAAQVALRLVTEGHQVHLLSRHPLRVHQFDSDPGWLGPKYMTRYGRERDLGRRRELIREARHKGSVPPDTRRHLLRAIKEDRLRWHEGAVLALDVRPSDLEIRLSSDELLTADRVLLATGLASRRPGGPMVDHLIDSASLPCADCGYPIVDFALRWHPRVRVSGSLAELELGPASRNISGARRAADRLVETIGTS